MAELSTIARPYAEALFESVRGDARGLEYWSGVMSLLAQVSGMPDVLEAMADPRLSDAQRTALLTGLVPQELPAQAANLVALVVENGRVQALPQVAEQFELLRNRLEGTALARITQCRWHAPGCAKGSGCRHGPYAARGGRHQGRGFTGVQCGGQAFVRAGVAVDIGRA